MVLPNHDFYRKKILAATTALLTDAEDLSDRKQLSFVFIVDTGTLLNHGDRSQAELFECNKLCRGREPCVEQSIISVVSNGLRNLQELDHDIRILYLYKPPSLYSKGEVIADTGRSDQVILFERYKKTAVNRKEIFPSVHASIINR